MLRLLQQSEATEHKLLLNVILVGKDNKVLCIYVNIL